MVGAMMGRVGTGLAVVLLLAPRGAWAQSQSDIVWPTYDRVEKPSDPGLGCRALGSEIAQVAADIKLLNHAKVRTEDVLRSAFDMERYAGTTSPGGEHMAGGPVNGKEAYATAREQIVGSLKVAEARRDHLKSLEPACKPEPQPVSAP